MTVFVYVNTAKQVGDIDHIKVFATVEAAEIWFREERPGGRRIRVRRDRPSDLALTDRGRPPTVAALPLILGSDLATALAFEHTHRSSSERVEH
jgi:hypothetical protein